MLLACAAPAQAWLASRRPLGPLRRSALAASSGRDAGEPLVVEVYDTSLRDGTQGEGISVSVNDKLNIARRLSSFGAHYIEAGWPGSNPKDSEFFARALKDSDDDEIRLDAATRSKIVAFGMTRRHGGSVDDDAGLDALLESRAPVICIVAKASRMHIEDMLGATLDEACAMARESVARLLAAEHVREVHVDLEHFFDGFRESEEYTLAVLSAAIEGGASAVTLCDTNGGSMPWEVAAGTAAACARVDAAGGAARVGFHCHNDRELAVANTLSAVRAGARLVQGTVNVLRRRAQEAVEGGDRRHLADERLRRRPPNGEHRKGLVGVGAGGALDAISSG